MCATLVRKGKAELQDRSPLTGWVALHVAALKGICYSAFHFIIHMDCLQWSSLKLYSIERNTQ